MTATTPRAHREAGESSQSFADTVIGYFEGNSATADDESTVDDEPLFDYGSFLDVDYMQLADQVGSSITKVTKFLTKHLAQTKLIFVFGKTGTGKSTLLSELTNGNLKIGHGVTSGTMQYGVWPAIIDSQKYLFVDTVGFGAGDTDDMSVFEDIMRCVAVFGPFAKFSGALFLHDARAGRMDGSEIRTLRWLQCFAGPSFYKHLTIVTTHWDAIHPDLLDGSRGLMKEMLDHKAMKDILHPTFDFDGGTVYHHGIKGGGATESWERPLNVSVDRRQRIEEVSAFIGRRYGHQDSLLPRLQVLNEVRYEGSLKATEAAKALRESPVSSEIVIRRQRAVVVVTGTTETEDGPFAEPGNGADLRSFLSALLSAVSTRDWLYAEILVGLFFMKAAVDGLDAAFRAFAGACESLLNRGWQTVKGFWQYLFPSAAA